jgi:pyruvate dehydrogenase E2 component (dihydrolipoyllysine-residue acetyltransferase)
MAEFRMPSLGADMEAGTLVEWMVKPGDRVNRGDVVAVVETQKGAIEIEIFEAGRVERILVDVGGKVPVGTPLARILSDHEVKAGVAEAQRAPETVAPAVVAPSVRAPTPPKPQVVAPPAALGRVRASPAARRFASARGINLSAIVGTGPFGAIVLDDVERATGTVVVTPSIERKRAAGLDLDAMRVAIAAAMARSKREIPHYYLRHQVDVTECEAFLSNVNAGRPPDNRLLMGVLLVKAVALAARRFPAFNGFHQDGQFKPSTGIHVGVAIAIRGGGLAAPAIHDSDQLALDELMARMRDLVQRVRAGRIRSSEMTDPTITVSSLGERGVEALYGVIYPPQVAIVGFGKVLARPWIVDGGVVPRSVVTVTLAADHRVSDGHAGALFLAEIAKLLQEPDRL